jgi:hypothetical protein
VGIGQRLSGLEVVLAVVIDSAKKSSAVERIGNIDRRLKACAHRIHVKDSPAKRDRTLRSPAAAEQMKESFRRPSDRECDCRDNSMAVPVLGRLRQYFHS